MKNETKDSEKLMETEGSGGGMEWWMVWNKVR